MQTFGEHLRRWRHDRSLSQLDVAGLADTSTRHLSFLESGRSVPGRDMVLRLASALDVTAAERDRALEVAGMRPVTRRAAPASTETAAMHKAISALVQGHGAMPAFVLDAEWRVLASNEGGARLLGALGMALPEGLSLKEVPLDPQPSSMPGMLDMLISLAHSDCILNWYEVAEHLMSRARAELVRRNETAPALADALVRLEAVVAAMKPTAEVYNDAGSGVTCGTTNPVRKTAYTASSNAGSDVATTSVVVPFQVRVGETTLSLITMIAQFGGVDYVDVDVPTVELMFPADDSTRSWFESVDSTTSEC